MGLHTLKSEIEWTGEATRCTGASRGFEVILDEPESMGGTDRGMNPVELLLNAVGGCQAVLTAAFAGSFNVKLEGLSVSVEGDFDPAALMGRKEDVRPGLTEVRVHVQLQSPSNPESVNKLVTFVKKHCPVSDSLQGSPVNIHFEHTQKEAP